MSIQPIQYWLVASCYYKKYIFASASSAPRWQHLSSVPSNSLLHLKNKKNSTNPKQPIFHLGKVLPSNGECTLVGVLQSYNPAQGLSKFNIWLAMRDVGVSRHPQKVLAQKSPPNYRPNLTKPPCLLSMPYACGSCHNHSQPFLS